MLVLFFLLQNTEVNLLLQQYVFSNQEKRHPDAMDFVVGATFYISLPVQRGLGRSLPIPP